MMVSDDAWLNELIVWANENKISEDKFPRNKQAILAMTELDLSDNQLTELPELIGKLTNLTGLYLSDNQLTELPEFIGKLTNLIGLELNDNQLTELPESISKLTNLAGLYLSDNQLTELPEFIGKLTNLIELSLNGNQLTELPELIGKLTNLTVLYLDGNQFTKLPESIGKLTKLTELSLDDNQLTELPESISKLTKLTELDLTWNPIKSLPPELNHLRDITRFDCSEDDTQPSFEMQLADTDIAKSIQELESEIMRLEQADRNDEALKLIGQLILKYPEYAKLWTSIVGSEEYYWVDIYDFDSRLINALREYVVFMDESKMLVVRDIAHELYNISEYMVDIEHFEENYTRFIGDVSNMAKIYNFLSENPGSLQNKIYKELSLDGRKSSYMLEMAEKYEKITRTRHKDTWLLQIAT